MIHPCPKCKNELRYEKTVDNINRQAKKIIYQKIDLYYCLHCRVGYTKIMYEYPIKGKIK